LPTNEGDFISEPGLEHIDQPAAMIGFLFLHRIQQLGGCRELGSHFFRK